MGKVERMLGTIVTHSTLKDGPLPTLSDILYILAMASLVFELPYAEGQQFETLIPQDQVSFSQLSIGCEQLQSMVIQWQWKRVYLFTSEKHTHVAGVKFPSMPTPAAHQTPMLIISPCATSP